MDGPYSMYELAPLTLYKYKKGASVVTREHQLHWNTVGIERNNSEQEPAKLFGLKGAVL